MPLDEFALARMIDEIVAANLEKFADRLVQPAKEQPLKPLYTQSEFAKLCGVSCRTVKNCIRQGKLKRNPAGYITAKEARRFGL